MPRLVPMSERLFLSGDDKRKNKEKLKKLTDRFNLPAYAGELFLEELKLSVEPCDNEAKDCARILGLM